MKTKWNILGIMMLLACCVMVFTSCGNDDDEKGGGGSGSGSLVGYWVPQSDLYDMARECIQNGWIEDDGGMGSALSLHFLNNNTVETFYAAIYAGYKSNSFYEQTISGRKVYYVPQSAMTYTYVVKDNKIVITNGSICTKYGNEIRIDGTSLSLTKIK